MEKQTAKLMTKDFIIAGAFAALYVALLLIVVSATGFIPIVYIFAPFILSVVLGTVYMLYAAKLPKRWSIMILAALVGLVTSMGGMWFSILWALLLGLAADSIANSGTRSRTRYILSFMVFACTNMGPFWALVFAKQRFLDACVGYSGQDYANAIDRLTPWWIIFVFLGMAIVGGFIGGLAGSRILKKHFEKAGIV
ncbi:MAG: MptD family putative ECF transporter S component [Treponema sp.]|jgi:energy-coupling factor transport system substrate-specific component|nr:MptD family putative ECF transporter S component [Treponema sp.]